MEVAVTWTQFMWIVGGIAGVGIAQVIAIWKMFQTLRDRIADQSDKLSAAMKAEDDKLHSRVSNANQKLDDYKLQSAKEFVTMSHLSEVEQRLTSSVGEIKGAIIEMGKSLTRVETLLESQKEERDREDRRGTTIGHQGGG